jgi:hypothetical protein
LNFSPLLRHIVQAMATAVEQAAAVLVLASRNYRESENCRSEASYAYQKRKPIIPIMAQGGYRPDGWLGFLMGTSASGQVIL